MGIEPINANNHWIEVFSSNALETIKEVNLSLPAIFSGIRTDGFDKFSGIVNNVFKEKLKPEDYIMKIYNDTLHQRLGGEEKYVNAMKNKHPSKQDIKDMLVKFRFIALCLSGQKEPEDWDWNESSLRTPINFSSTYSDSLSPTELRNLLKRILEEMILGIVIL